MLKVPLSKGMFARVDDQDYVDLMKHTWHINAYGYACRSVHLGKDNGKYRTNVIYMHRQILGAEKGQIADHINRDTLDNRRSNLRLINATESVINRGINKNNTSGYKGVYWNRKDKKWQAYIGHNKKKLYLGQFDVATEAAQAFNKAAKRLHGNYAELNKC